MNSVDGAVELQLPCLDNTYLAAKVWGDHAKSHQMALCVHGSLDNAASFNGLGAALARCGIYVVAVDLFGHGLSPSAPGGIYSHELWALGVLDALASTGWTKELIMIGHSLGTDICTLVAGALATSRRPTGLKLTHVVMLDGSGLGGQRAREVDHSKSARKFLERVQLLRRGIQRRYAEDKEFESLDQAVSRRMKKNVGGQPIKRSTAHDIVQRGSKVSTSGKCTFSHDVPQLMFSSIMAGQALLPSVESVQSYFRVLPSAVFIVAHSPVSGKPYWPWLWQDVLANSRLCPHGNILRVTGYHHWHADHAEECCSLIMQFLSGEELQDNFVDDAADPANYDTDTAAKQLAVAEQMKAVEVGNDPEAPPSKL